MLAQAILDRIENYFSDVPDPESALCDMSVWGRGIPLGVPMVSTNEIKLDHVGHGCFKDVYNLRLEHGGHTGYVLKVPQLETDWEEACCGLGLSGRSAAEFEWGIYVLAHEFGYGEYFPETYFFEHELTGALWSVQEHVKAGAGDHDETLEVGRMFGIRDLHSSNVGRTSKHGRDVLLDWGYPAIDRYGWGCESPADAPGIQLYKNLTSHAPLMLQITP